jgi:hypothetical protein
MMRASYIACAGLALLAACTDVDRALDVLATVELAPEAGISGRLDVLARNVRDPDAYGYMMAAYGVVLPDDELRHVQLWSGTCAAPQPLLGPEPFELGELRRIDGAGHFVSPVQHDGRVLLVDIQTVNTPLDLSEQSIFDVHRLVVAIAADRDGVAGERQTCGAFSVR